MSEGRRQNPLWLAALAFVAGLAALVSWHEVWGYLAFAAGGGLLFAHSLSARRGAEQAARDAEQAARDAEQAAREARDAEARSRVDAERLATALDAANLGTWDWQVVSGATFWSPNIDAILGRAPGTFERTFAAYMALVHPEDRASVEQAIQTVLQRGHGSYTSRHRIVAPDGALHWMESKGRLDSDEHGKPLRLVGTLVDISAHLNREERNAQLQEQLRQAQKLEALGTLAGGIAHDFNNILGVIVAYTQVAQLDNPDHAELQQQLGEVVRASARAANLVQQILSFGRRQPQERKACSLTPVFREALKLLRSTLPATIEVREDIAPNLPEVMADPLQMHQVLMSLCTNASHAMRGRGQLCLELSRYRLGPDAVSPHVELRPGNYLRIAVTDTGEGMDEQVLVSSSRFSVPKAPAAASVCRSPTASSKSTKAPSRWTAGSARARPSASTCPRWPRHRPSWTTLWPTCRSVTASTCCSWTTRPRCARPPSTFSRAWAISRTCFKTRMRLGKPFRPSPAPSTCCSPT